MIFDHQYENYAIYAGATVKLTVDFTNDLDSGDSVSAINTVTAEDDDGNDVTSTIISSSSVTSPYAYVVVSSISAGKTYQLIVKVDTTAGRVLIRRLTIDGVGTVVLNPKLGAPDANSYVSLKEANDYIRNNFYHPDQWDKLTFEGRKRVLIQAARDIDRMNFRGNKYYDSQALQFPRDDHEVYTGNASVGTTTTFRGTNLYSSTYNEIPDNYFKYGTVHIKTGQHPREIRYIASSIATPGGGYGQITVSSPFSGALVASDEYIVFKPLYDEVKFAQCEQAAYIIENKLYRYADYRDVGIGYMRSNDLGVSFRKSVARQPKLCLKARRFLGRHLRKTIRIGRA